MLHQSDTDVLFPPRVIGKLRNLRGPLWQQLVDRVSRHDDEKHIEVLAFVLLMIRQNSCLNCNAHSYRAMRGCTTCSVQIVNRIKLEDAQLVKEWELICTELSESLPGLAAAQSSD